MESGETTFHENEYSWNNETNMLYIEMPAGVGYSYSTNPDEYHFTDNSTAADNLKALLFFYAFKFPELQSNELWISGESYGGIYVPTLAYEIH